MLQEVAQLAGEPEQFSEDNILVVDHDGFGRDLLVRRLQRAGYRVTATGDGSEVPNLLETQNFSLLLLDIAMAAISWRELLAVIRAKYSLSVLPVVMVSSRTESEDVAECFRLGANDYVTKPIEMDLMLARIEAHISRQKTETGFRQSQDELERRVEQRTAELRRANRELEDSRDILADALEAIGDGFVIWDREDRLIACNQRYREYFGNKSDLVKLGTRFESLMREQFRETPSPCSPAAGPDGLERRLTRHRNPADPFEEECSDGTWLRISETRTDNGRTVGLCTDISGIKRREIALKTFAETNRRLAAAVNAAESAIVITDPARQGNPTIFANPAFTAMTGWPIEEALGRDRRMLIGVETDLAEADRLDKSMRNGVAINTVLRLYARDGSSFWAEISASPIRDSSGEIVNWVIIQTDITGRKETEEQLRQSQKMETVGQLTGGLAHDFNNLLTVVMGNLEFVLSRPQAFDSETRQHLEAAYDAGRRGSELTKRMLTFARRRTLAPKPTDLRLLITDFRNLLDRSLGDAISVEYDLAEELWPVLIDRSQMENAILNLAVNARDAMGGSGVVRLGISKSLLEGSMDVSGCPIPDGDYVCVEVSDSGAGMSAQVARKAIQPFFTTKASGKGSGLGLSMVYGFVSQSGGFLDIESEAGNGATVRMYFPRAASCDVGGISESGQHVEGGSETILLVDDEPQVRTIAAILLQRLGYEVIQAEDGPEALELLSDSSHSIDLLVTDIGLPGGMDGLELVAAIRKKEPKMPALYVSGYSDGKFSDLAEQDSEVPFLAKPYDLRALAIAVRDALALK